MPNAISVLGKGFCDHMGPRVELKPTQVEQDSILLSPADALGQVQPSVLAGVP